MSEGKLRLAFGIQQEFAELEADLVTGKISHAEASARLEDSLKYTRECMSWCIEHMEDDKRAAIVCSKIAGVAGRLLRDHIPRLELLQWREAGLKGARLGGTLVEEVAHLTDISFLHFANNNPQAALELSSQAVALAAQLDEKDAYATTLQNQAIILSQTGAIDKAIEGLREAEAIHERSGNRSAQAKVLSTLAICFSQLGNSEGTIELYRKAIELETDQVAIGTYYANVADELIGSSNLAEARRAISKAEQIATDTKAKILMGLVHLRWARWRALQDDEESHKETVRRLVLALTDFRDMGDAHHMMQALQMQEQTYTALASPDYDFHSDEYQSIGLRGLCSALYAQGKYDEELQVALQLLKVGTERMNLVDQLIAALGASRSAIMLEQYTAAIGYANIGKIALSGVRLAVGPKAYSKEEEELDLILSQANRINDTPLDALV